MRKYLGLIIVILLSWWAIAPLFNQFMFPVHDDTQEVRIYEMAKALREGQFPVRWIADLGYGYGYPIFNFYSPLPYYFGAIFFILGADLLMATKLMFIVGILASGIFMYLFAREFWGELGGIISSLFFVYAPYHAVQIYVRGSVGEFWAYGFLPLATLGIYKATKERKWTWVIVGSLGYAGIILSHNITALIFTIFLSLVVLTYLFLTFKNLTTIYYLLSTIFFGLALSAFFWSPALLEKDFTNIASLTTGESDFRIHFVCPRQLWDSPWGYGGSIVGCEDGLSFKTGKLHILMTVFAFLLGLWWWNKERLKAKIILFSKFFLLFSIFMMLGISKPIWGALPFMAFVQYPWRFLVFIIFFTSFLAGTAALVLTRLHKKYLEVIFVGGILVLLVFNLKMLPLRWEVKYFLPQFYLTAKSEDYLTSDNLKWRVSKISDEYLPKDFPRPESKNEIVQEKLIPTKEVVLSEIKILSSYYEFKALASEEGNVLIKTAYFPGWKVLLDGREVGFEIQEGQILISVPPGEHKFKVVFSNTPVRTAGNLISLTAILTLMGGFLYERKGKA